MADLDAYYRLELSREYLTRFSKNKKYSKNAFARFLKIDSTYLSKLMSGKILLSLDVATQITELLKLSSEKRADFLLSVAEEQRCHALYLIDPALTDCDVQLDELNRQPQPRRK